MTQTPEERRAAWEAYISRHKGFSESLRTGQGLMDETTVRLGLAMLHDSIADLAIQIRHREEASTSDPSQPEYHKVRQEHLYNMAANRFRSAADFARLGLQSALIANGGALVAMLTFLGNTELDVGGCGLWIGFGSFTLGLLAALVATLLAYRTQSAYGRQEAAGSDKIYFHLLRDEKHRAQEEAEEDRQMAIGRGWEIGGVIAYAFTLFFFMVGAVAGVLALTAATAH